MGMVHTGFQLFHNGPLGVLFRIVKLEPKYICQKMLLNNTFSEAKKHKSGQIDKIHGRF